MSDPAADSALSSRTPPRKPLRLLVVLPSWLGDAVMATPALRLLRSNLPGAFIGALMRPGIDELLAGTDLIDEFHVDRARGMMGPKLAANKLRPRRYDTALLLTNSFSTALITRLAFIPRRIGYDRDARGLLLTDKLPAERTGSLAGFGLGNFACISAVDYYLRAAHATIVDGFASKVVPGNVVDGFASATLPTPRLELSTTPAEDQSAAAILQQAHIAAPDRYAILNPGANNPAKRWPPDRFAAAAVHLIARHNLHVLMNGGPSEHDLVADVIARALQLGAPAARLINLPNLNITIGALKPIVRASSLMLTNDTGPRHIGAAFNIPLITLFGPTDPRWTTLPPSSIPNIELTADPTLPKDQLADDHPDRCRIERIEVPTVLAALDGIRTPI